MVIRKMKSKGRAVLAMVALAVSAMALFAAMAHVHSADSVPLSPAEQAERLIPQLATGSTSASLTSSSPYDYAADNPKMDALVALGTPALVELDKSIGVAPDDGLDTYLMAIAAEKIARVNLRSSMLTEPWETGRGWMSQWHAHLEAIPENVAAIANSDLSQDEKTTRLLALGTPALPFILDRVAAGDATLAPAAARLASHTVEVEGTDVPAVITRAWAKDEVASFAGLRQIVQAHE